MTVVLQALHSILQVIGRRFSGLWRLATEPPDGFQDPELRRRARLLLSLLTLMVPLGPLGAIASYALTAPPSFSLSQNLVFFASLATGSLLAIAYWLGRSKEHFTSGAIVTLFTLSFAPIAATIFDPQEADTLLVFLSFDVLLASLLLSLPGTIALAVIVNLTLLLLPVLVPDLSVTSVANILIFLVFSSALIIVSAVIRQQDLQQIEQQTHILSDLYAQSERDAEAMERVKNRLEAILNSVGEGLVVVSLDGYVELVNPAFEEQTGYTAGEVALRHYDDLVLGNRLPAAVEEDAYAAMDAGRIWRGDMPVERKDGATYDAAVTIAPVRSRSGEVIAFAISLRDISALKEVERMKDDFVSNVSHELRTPISSLKIYLSLLETAPPEELHKYIATLVRETNRLHLIIEDVLRLSRLDQGRVPLSLTKVDLNKLASQYVSDRAPLARSEGLTLTLVQQANLLPVQADEGLLGQVLSILLTNAINYVPVGGRIVVSPQSLRLDKRWWSGFSVSDTGPGIPPSEQRQLFRRFFRGQVGRKSGKAGTGLGLAIAKEIVDLHGGRIEVGSEGVPGKGTTFHVWLPAVEK